LPTPNTRAITSSPAPPLAAPFVATTDSSGNVTASLTGNTASRKVKLPQIHRATARPSAPTPPAPAPRTHHLTVVTALTSSIILIALRNDLQAGNTAAIGRHGSSGTCQG